MSGFLYDDNGNPMDEQEDEIEIIGGKVDYDSDDESQLKYAKINSSGEHEQEATYFINAAAVSDDEGVEYMAGSRSGDTFNNRHNDQVCEGSSTSTTTATTTTVDKEIEKTPEKSKVKTENENNESFVLFDKVNPYSYSRSRVPISRSFPDIIQTTMTEPMFKINPSMTTTIPELKSKKEKPEYVLTDSLEELVDVSNENEKDNENKKDKMEQQNNEAEKARKSEPLLFNLDDSTSNLSELSSSVAGISYEKPPDSWTIDFNSLSIEENITESEPKSSNSNSLAFFIDMNETLPHDNEPKLESSYNDPKKIFPLFIDIGEKQAQQQQQQQKSTTGAGENKSIKMQQYIYYGKNGPSSISPSPGIPSGRETRILDTSFYGYGSKKVAPNGPMSSGSNYKTITKGKFRDYNNSLMPIKKDCPNPNTMSTISNRSSLHVASHDLEDMFASSILSSMETSVPDDEDMESCLKLGMDLLRMFQEGINTDVQISVHGRYIKAHKCILASRSQYFAAILSGNRIEKSGNTIHLDEFSYSVVQFTLYHIYSGTNEIPDSIDLVELTSLTDLLGLEGLREIISNTIKVKFAHNFHRPCSSCIIGVIQFFPISISYGMDELSRKMTKWMSKHFVRIWPTKAFASLGDELIQKCLSYTANHLSGENLLDITLGCDQLLNTMPNIKWAETIFSIVHQLTQACIQFIGEHFCDVLQSQRFLVFGKGQAWNISRIETTFLEGMSLLKPDEACLSHVCLRRLIELGTEAFDEAFVEFLVMLRKEIEKYLLANASRIVLSRSWERLDENTRKKICSTGFLGHEKSSGKKVTTTKNTASTSAQGKTSRPTSSTTSSVRTPLSGPKTSWKSAQKSDETNNQLLDASPTSGNVRQILSPTDASKTAKVASVRPMPSIQHQNVFSSRQTTAETRSQTKNAERASNSGRLASKPLSQHKLGVKNTEREKSFDNSASSSSSFSNHGSQSKPMTPSTPSRPKSFPHHRNLKLSPHLDDKPATPTKPVFLTNSEKAKAVSKPPLRMRSSRSNSVSNKAVSASTNVSASHSRQSSIGSNITAPPSAGISGAQPRTPNLSQPSRYANSLTTVRKPLDKLAQSTIGMPKSPAPKGRVNSANTNARRIGNTTTTTTNISNRGGKQQPIQRNLKGNGANANNKDTNKLVNKIFSNDFDSGSDSDNLMTKSNMEMEVSSSNEPKIRTLAEIGRSNTFSKDEPTVLGKMDFSLEMEYTQI